MQIDTQDIIKVCGTISDFVKNADMRFKALPVLAFEFVDMSSFMSARMNFLQAIEPQLIYPTGKGRRVDDHTEEFDCYGVTVRLICRERGLPALPSGYPALK